MSLPRLGLTPQFQRESFRRREAATAGHFRDLGQHLAGPGGVNPELQSRLPGQLVTAAVLVAHPALPFSHPDGLVFTDDDGEALRRTAFSREVWRPTIKKIHGIPATTGMHDRRHYYASLLIRHGESVKTVQRRLSHATAAETLDTYSHLWPDSDDRTRDAIDAVLGDVPPACPADEVN